MPIEIIAEIAQGYEGSITQAILLARGAVRAGADAVKYQCVYADELATPDYQHYKLFKDLEMPIKAWQDVAEIIKSAGKRFYLDVFGEKSLELAVNLKANGIKIHATDFYNTDLVRAAIKAMPKIFISLGGISIEELEQFLKYHRISPGPQVCLMFGFQAEPTPIEANNLLRIGEIKKRFSGFPIGFMDHSDGSTDDSQTLALLTLPFEIDYIEKHMTLDRVLELEDYPSAICPKDFQTFIKRVRRLEEALGSASLELSEAEQTYRKKVLKVVVARKLLKKGDSILEEDISLKRVSIPGLIPIYRKEDVTGKILKSDVQKHQQITKEIIK